MAQKKIKVVLQSSEKGAGLPDQIVRVAINPEAAREFLEVHAGMTAEVVDTLPETGESGKLYLVPSAKAKSKNKFEEYIWAEKDGEFGWESIGATDVDLSNYYTKAEIDVQVADIESEIEKGVFTEIDNGTADSFYFGDLPSGLYKVKHRSTGIKIAYSSGSYYSLWTQSYISETYIWMCNLGDNGKQYGLIISKVSSGSALYHFSGSWMYALTPNDDITTTSSMLGNAPWSVSGAKKLIGGGLDTLKTTDKSSLIAAINEVAQNSGSGDGIKEIVVDTDDLPQVTFPQSGVNYNCLDISSGTTKTGYQGVNYKYLSLEELVGDTPGVYQLTVMGKKTSPTTTWLGVAPTIPTISDADMWGIDYNFFYYALGLYKVTQSSQDVSFPYTFTVIVTKGGTNNLDQHFTTWTLFNNFSGYGGAMYSMGRYLSATSKAYRYTGVGYLSTSLSKEVRGISSDQSNLWASVNQLNNNVVRSDYNVNASSSYAYIENRPFYDTRASHMSSVTFKVCQDSDWYNNPGYTVAGQWNTYDEFTGVGDSIGNGERVKITITQGANSSTFTGKIYVYDDEMMMGKQVTIYNDSQSEGEFAIYASYNAEMYPGIRLSAEVMGTLDATEAIDSITVEPVAGELKQLDSKFIKIDNNTIKINENGELYVDLSALNG